MKPAMKWMYDYHIAHRGYFDDEAPENSLKAFQKAIDRNFAIELDVQLLKDGTLVVFHDKILNRMTGYDAYVKAVTYETIKELSLLNTDQSIPTFEEVLDLVDGQVPLMVEIKNESHYSKTEEKTYELLKNYQGPYVIQSFNPMSLIWFKKHAPHVVRGQLSCRHENQKMNFILKFLIRNVMTNIITQPDYVIYDIKGWDTWIIKWLKFRKKPLFGYTAKSINDYEKSQKYAIPTVFEQFDPQNL